MQGQMLVFFLLLTVALTTGTIYIVDEAGTGDATSLGTLPSLSPGDIIQMRGTFHARQVLTGALGAAGNYITVTNYPGSTPTINGASASLPGFNGLVQIVNSNYIIVENLLVQNSNQHGINLDYSNNTIIRNNVVHDVWLVGIVGCGAHVLVENNDVYHASLRNTYKNVTGWPPSIRSSPCGGDGHSQDWTFSKNRVREGYGEGIICFKIIGCRVLENVVWNTFAPRIYIDNAQNVIVEKNFVFNTNFDYLAAGKQGSGIIMGGETYAAGQLPTVNVTVQNNLIKNVGTAIGSYVQDNNYVSDIRIYSNTLWGLSKSISFVTQSVAPANMELRNNIIRLPANGACTVVSPGAWTKSNNVFVGQASLPSQSSSCADTGTPSSVFVANSLDIAFAGDPDKIGALDIDFVLNSTSPAVGVAIPLAAVPKDYFDFSRTSSRAAGFAEYGTDTSTSRGNGTYIPSQGTTTTTSGVTSASGGQSTGSASSASQRLLPPFPFLHVVLF